MELDSDSIYYTCVITAQFFSQAYCSTSISRAPTQKNTEGPAPQAPHPLQLNTLTLKPDQAPQQHNPKNQTQINEKKRGENEKNEPGENECDYRMRELSARLPIIT